MLHQAFRIITFPFHLLTTSSLLLQHDPLEKVNIGKFLHLLHILRLRFSDLFVIKQDPCLFVVFIWDFLANEGDVVAGVDTGSFVAGD